MLELHYLKPTVRQNKKKTGKGPQKENKNIFQPLIFRG